jgi:hypothetical protein
MNANQLVIAGAVIPFHCHRQMLLRSLASAT